MAAHFKMTTTKTEKQKRNEYMRNYYRKKVGDKFGKSKFTIRYTQKEIDFIKNNYKNMSNLQLSKELGKSLHSIKSQMKTNNLNLKRTNKEISAHRKNALNYMKSIGPRKYVLNNHHWREMVTVDKNKRVLKSHFIWCSQPGNLSYVPKGFLIHHIDLNPKNNSPDNLFLINKINHNQLHNDISRIIRRTL